LYIIIYIYEKFFTEKYGKIAQEMDVKIDVEYW